MSQLTKWEIPYERVRHEDLDEYFRSGIDQDLAELLLHNVSTAIFHVDAQRTDCLGDPEDSALVYAKPLLLGVNYHLGSSEGYHKIVVQNIPERKGPYVLFRPLG